MRYIILHAMASASALLAACAPLRADDLAQCTVPVSRDAGLGVRVESCAAWVIPPTAWSGPIAR